MITALFVTLRLTATQLYSDFMEAVSPKRIEYVF